jgi:hypothetical protein
LKIRTVKKKTKGGAKLHNLWIFSIFLELKGNMRLPGNVNITARIKSLQRAEDFAEGA